MRISDLNPARVGERLARWHMARMSGDQLERAIRRAEQSHEADERLRVAFEEVRFHLMRRLDRIFLPILDWMADKLAKMKRP